jgi:pyroglutamyl-peptidase
LKTILATGFGAFPGAPTNPTAWLIEDFATWSPPVRLITRVLPVTYDVWETTLLPLLEEAKPDAVVAFGLRAQATGFTFERLARNQLAVDRPDAEGKLAGRARIRADGPATIASRLPAMPSLAQSDDAGDYICNLTMYRLLDHGLVAGFIHLPEMSEPELRAGGRAILDAVAQWAICP